MDAYLDSPEGKKDTFKGCLIYSVAGALGAVAGYFFDSFFYGFVTFCVCGTILIFCFHSFKGGLGCSMWSAFAVGAMIIVLNGVPPLHFRSSDVVNNQMNEQNTMVESKDVKKQKIPTYLQGVDNISSNRDLSNFYFSVANKFYHNDMGLKGTQEQIDAGNNLMVRVYDFLGSSARRKMLDIDSMKAFVKNYAGVSDFRRKKALEDLQMGVDKIESLKE